MPEHSHGEEQHASPGDRLDSALQTLGITQAEAARRLKVGPGYVNDVLRGRRGMTAGFARDLAREFGIEKVWLLHGKGQMLRSLPAGQGIAEGLALVPVPLLDHPCRGNPLDSPHWLGSTHPLPRGLARPTAPDNYRYVLRVNFPGLEGEVRYGDLVLVENLAKPDEGSLEGRWCTGLIRSEVGISVFTLSSRVARVHVWGRCLGILWRPLAPLD